MIKKTKQNCIKSSQEVLRVESVFQKHSVLALTSYYTLLTSFTLFLLYKAIISMPKEMLILIIPALIIFFIAVCFAMNRLLARGNPLVFTNTGIYLEPFVYEKWEDIDGYSFKKYTGPNRTTFSSKGTGVTLSFSNKGLVQRTTNLRGHSFIATNGIFLTDSQINAIEALFKAHGIRRNILNDELV